jgi:hypothetical protein
MLIVIAILLFLILCALVPGLLQVVGKAVAMIVAVAIIGIAIISSQQERQAKLDRQAEYASAMNACHQGHFTQTGNWDRRSWDEAMDLMKECEKLDYLVSDDNGGAAFRACVGKRPDGSRARGEWDCLDAIKVGSGAS